MRQCARRDAPGCGPDQGRRGENNLNVRPISGASVDARRRGGKGRLALISGVLLLAVTACGGGGSGSGSCSGKGKGADAAQTKQSVAVVTIAPKDGAKSVETSGVLKVSTTKGKL